MDRETLWNEVEAGERRVNSQLAREVEVSLPRELRQAEAVQLARDYVREQFVSRGMIADLNLHWGQASDGRAQPHMHVMLTMRHVGPDGFGTKAREWNVRALATERREEWSKLANERLAELGHTARIDHRSHAERGISLEPGTKVGAVAMRIAERGETADRLEQNRAIAERNAIQAELVAVGVQLEPGQTLRTIAAEVQAATKAATAELGERRQDRDAGQYLGR